MTEIGEITRLVTAAGGIVSLDARAVRASVTAAATAGRDDLERPTPCGDWTLADLLAHMTAQHHGFAAAAGGHGADASAWAVRPPAADPVAACAAAADAVLAAFAADGVLGREFALPEIAPGVAFPAARAISFHFIDYVVHGWDVARSLGQDYDLDPDLRPAALAVAQAVPDGAGRRRPGAAFAPGLAVPEGGRPLDRIVARLGRRPDWRP